MPSAEMNQDEGLMPPPLEVDSSTTLSSSATHSGATQTAPTVSCAEAPCGGVPQTPAPSAPPLVPMRVKPLRPDDGAAGCAGTVVQMSLLRDLRLRIDKRTLVAEELAGLGPEMADTGGDDDECRPQCMVCLEELEEGHAVSRQGCGHTFHHECMATWLESQLQQKKNGCCPHCKHVIVAPIIQRVPPPKDDPPRRRTRMAEAWYNSMARLTEHVRGWFALRC